MGWNTVTRQSLTDGVVEQILHLIEEQELRPHSALPSEAELMKRLGVGRSTVRESLERLVALGVISRTRAGTIVADDVTARLVEMRSLERVRAETIDHLYEARVALEAGSARLAAQRRTAEDLAQLGADIERLKQAISAQDSHLLAIDLAFHRHLVRASHNPVLTDLHTILLARFQENLPHVATISGLADQSLANHITVLNHLSLGDPGQAAQAVRQALQGVQERVRSALYEDRDMP
jgi:DNA-binding FadR family transcriptional regulator